MHSVAVLVRVARLARLTLSRGISFAVVLAAVLLSSRAAVACPVGNLLEGKIPTQSRGVASPELSSDGRLTWEGDLVSSPVATQMKGLRPFIEWDLGAPTPVVALAVQADNNDVYRVVTSLDGEHYEPAWTLPTNPSPGLHERVVRDLKITTRFLRFEAISGDQEYFVTEVRAWCEPPAVWPPSRLVRDQEPRDPESTRHSQFQSLKLAIGLLAFPFLFLVLPRLGVRGKKVLYAVTFVLAALCWTQFARFNGGEPLHAWDVMHYFMGSKYFPEVGYHDLYRCGAKALREDGRAAEVDKQLIRDVDDNQLYPGDWSRTEAGACRGHFTPERWTAFKSDLAAFHTLLTGNTVAESFGDHGFNGTPLDVSWLRLFTTHMNPSHRALTWLSQLDSLALVGTVVALTWAFGPLAGVVAALVLALGGMWNYHWVGGSLTRHNWLFCVALGVAFLGKGRYFWGGVMLTIAGLFRLFPFVFVGAAGLWVIVQAVRARALDAGGKRYLAGVALSLALFGAIPAATLGLGTYQNFARVFQRHSHTTYVNQFGLSTVLAYTAGEDNEKMYDERLTNPHERWERHKLDSRVQRRPLWALAVLVSLGVIVLQTVRGASIAEAVAWGALLLFSMLPMTSYDYTWIVVLVALHRAVPRVLPLLLAFAVFTHVLFVFGGEAMEEQHLIGALVFGVVLGALVPWRALANMLLPPAPPESAV